MLEGYTSGPSLRDKYMAEQMNADIDARKFFFSHRLNRKGILRHISMGNIQDILFSNLIFSSGEIRL